MSDLCKKPALGYLVLGPLEVEVRVHDLTSDGSLSTYDESVLKLSKVSFRGKCARTGHPLKLPSPTKPARMGHFPTASQAGRLGPVFYVLYISFSEENS